MLNLMFLVCSEFLANIKILQAFFEKYSNGPSPLDCENPEVCKRKGAQRALSLQTNHASSVRDLEIAVKREKDGHYQDKDKMGEVVG